MRYCLDYYHDSQWLDTVDEININYKGTPEQFENLLKFLEKHKNQKTNLCVNSADFDTFFNTNNINLFNALHQEHPEYNFAIRFYETMRRPSATWDLDARVKSYLQTARNLRPRIYLGILVEHPALLWYLLSLDVSEVYISGYLGFCLHQCAQDIHDHGCLIRILPNIVQGDEWIPTIQRFFIRPDDVPYYEGLVDTMEIFGDKHIPSVIYGAYLDQEWFGPLHEIIYNIGSEPLVDNRQLLPVFGEMRTKCKQRCMFVGSYCNICQKLVDISDVLREKNLVIMKDTKADL